jgi:hypothetical protein
MVINIWGIIIYDSASFPILWACHKSLITVITLKIVFYKVMIIKLTRQRYIPELEKKIMCGTSSLKQQSTGGHIILTQCQPVFALLTSLILCA